MGKYTILTASLIQKTFTHLYARLVTFSVVMNLFSLYSANEFPHVAYYAFEDHICTHKYVCCKQYLCFHGQKFRSHLKRFIVKRYLAFLKFFAFVFTTVYRICMDNVQKTYICKYRTFQDSQISYDTITNQDTSTESQRI